MIVAEIKSILQRLNPSLTKALESSVGQCVSRNHYEVTLEHLLFQCAHSGEGDFKPILDSFRIDMDEFGLAVGKELADMKKGNTGKPLFSPNLLQVLELAWMESSLNLGQSHIRSGAILLVLSRNLNLVPISLQTYFHQIQHGVLWDKFKLITVASSESMAAAPIAASAPGAKPTGESAGLLQKYATDFTELARSGKIDPIFGRDKEVAQVIDILGRRRKNNPILIGEAGVGKTAVIEGLALKIVEGNVPEVLKDAHIWGLDLGMLSAGAGVRGEFENRLKGILKELKESTSKVLLFIDEAHTLIGAGGEAGKNDAANLLKPELARGELKCLAATTFSEYRKYFEKDPAMSRRFQAVTVEEPSVTTAAVMLRGIKPKYEKFHGVAISQEAIQAACEFSDRYIAGRQLPDKAIDLLDTATARVKLTQSAMPASLQMLDERVLDLKREQEVLHSDQANGLTIPVGRIEDIDTTLAALAETRAGLESAWQKEKTLVEAILAAPSPEDRIRLQGELSALQAEAPLVEPFVTAASVARIIEEWTGIPAGSMMQSDAVALANLEDTLNQRVIGQSWGIHEIANTIKSARLGLTRPETPKGVFLVTGPSGVGKTEVAKAIADQIFGGEDSVLTLNMSEYQDSMSVTQLKGASAGYVGYGEGGVLTEAVRRRPYTVVILDEVEKAHRDVLNMFYQVFDQGMLRDGEGRMINFRNTIILMTSNLGTDTILEMASEAEKDYSYQEYVDAVYPQLEHHFQQALLARCKPVPFLPLGRDTILQIVAVKLDKLASRIRKTHGCELQVDEAMLARVAELCTRGQTGARNIDAIIDQQVLPGLTNMLLASIAGGTQIVSIQVGADEGGFIFYRDPPEVG